MGSGIQDFAKAFAEQEGLVRAASIAAGGEVLVSHLVLSAEQRLNKTRGTGNLEERLTTFGEVTQGEVFSINVGSDVVYMMIHDTGGEIVSSRGGNAHLAIPNRNNSRFFSRFGGTNPAPWPRDIPKGELYRTGKVLRDSSNPDMKTNVAYYLAQSVTIPRTDYIKIGTNQAIPDIYEVFETRYAELMEMLANEIDEGGE